MIPHLNVLISIIILLVIFYHNKSVDCADPSTGKMIGVFILSAFHLIIIGFALQRYSTIQTAREKKNYLINLLLYIISVTIFIISLVYTIKYCQDSMFWFVLLWPIFMSCFLIMSMSMFLQSYSLFI